MTSPGVTQEGGRPAGVMPRNIQYLVAGGIALLVILATFWSGGRPRKSEEPASTAGPTPGQLQSFQQMLEKQRREADEQAAKRSARLREEQVVQAAGPVASGPLPAVTPDPVEEQKRKLAASAPFASNYVRVGEADEIDEKASADRASQIVVAGETRKVDASPSSAKVEETPHPKESGHLLPHQEGDLFRIFEGTTVHAALANRLDGSFTGPVNCVVSTSVLSQDETALLIPKGSRFIGKANRVEAENQTRLAVTFKRLIMPNGYSVDLEAAPGLDSEGETGLKGKVNNHNLRKFGMAGAIGLLGDLSLVAAPNNLYAQGVASSMGSSATNILNHHLNAVPTITVPEGHPVAVYLPNDLLLPAYRP